MEKVELFFKKRFSPKLSKVNFFLDFRLLEYNPLINILRMGNVNEGKSVFSKISFLAEVMAKKLTHNQFLL